MDPPACLPGVSLLLLPHICPLKSDLFLEMLVCDRDPATVS